MSRRRRPPSAVSALALLAGSLLAVGGSAIPAQAAPSVVTDGNARFEVLSPTLIRLEYAGDRSFQDATTFNVVNRDFPAPSYTTVVSADGYREIRTSALTLRYKQNSGPFTAANLSVALSTGVTAAPAFPSYCAYSTACEAENALITGSARPSWDHTGHTGSAFIAGYETTGSSVAVDVSGVPAAGSYKLQVRYANAAGSDNQSTTRTLSTRINGAAGPTLSMPATANWDTWGTASSTVNLPAGTSTVTVVRNASDSGRVNIDSVALTPTSATSFPAASTALLTTSYGAGPKDALGGWTRSLDNPGLKFHPRTGHPETRQLVWGRMSRCPVHRSIPRSSAGTR